MRKLIALLALLVASPSLGQPTTSTPPRYTVATKPPCADGSPKIIALTNAQATNPCTSASTGALDVLCQCKDGTYSELGVGDGPTNYAASASPAGPASSVAANSVALSTDTTGNYVSTAATGGGLALVGTEGASLGLLTTCADTEILKWSGAPTSAWACAADAGGPANYAASASPAGPASSVAANGVALSTDTTGDYVSNVTAGGGLTKTGTEGASLGMTPCADGQSPLYTGAPTNAWGCVTPFAAADVPAAETDAAHDTADEVGAVAKQATTPGTQQTGNSNLSGTGIFGTQVTTPTVIGGTSGTSTLTLDGDSTVAGVVTVGPNGDLTVGNTWPANPVFRIDPNANGPFITRETNSWAPVFGTVQEPQFTIYGGIRIDDNKQLGWGDMSCTDVGGIGGFTCTVGSTHYATLYSNSGGWMQQRYPSIPQSYSIYGLADVFPTMTNVERLTLACDGAGACSIGTETAGTGVDNVPLTIKGEGPVGGLTLDGSDDVAGAMTVGAAGNATIGPTYPASAYLRVDSNGNGPFIARASSTWSMILGSTGLAVLDVSAGGAWVNSDLNLGWRGLTCDSGAPSDSAQCTEGAADAGFGRSAAGVVKVTNGSTGIGALLHSVLVEANTAVAASPNILTVTESNTLLTNEGIAAQNYHTLPLAAAGLCFEFAVQDADGIRIVANTADTIRIAGSVSAAAGFIQNSTIGSTIRLCALNSVEWFAMGTPAGTWTIDS